MKTEVVYVMSPPPSPLPMSFRVTQRFIVFLISLHVLLIYLTFQIRIHADNVALVFAFVRNSIMANKIKSCLKLRSFPSDVCLSGTRSKNVAVLRNKSCKVHLTSTSGVTK